MRAVPRGPNFGDGLNFQVNVTHLGPPADIPPPWYCRIQSPNSIGAVHEIFHKNARANPDRPCVTETASSTTAERRFTYKQIYEASNILANQLHDAGITNGDVVVMIFAYRSVELVIAFMGTLTAGATIAVLDPAYPPARQQIYVQVSQPKALISAVRAKDENGPFAPLVQKYIDEELSLKTNVPEITRSSLY
ncbi:large subunit of alpha-aminoadipate reductase [Metarhizium acridum]|nr:large subunit of alpha-aminoadipate reductase [Metarhizium acridum]